MPPSAAPEWLRVGCSLETMATSAPASNASIAARMPAQPAPTTSTSCLTLIPTTLSMDAQPESACRCAEASGARARRRRPPGPTSSANAARSSSRNIPASSCAFASYADGSRHVERGSRSACSTPGHLDRHLEAEDLVDPVVDAVEPARERRVEERARRRDRHALALAVRPPVQPVLTSQTVAAVPLELLAEHARVDRRRLRQERRAEARRERRLRLLDPDLGPCELRGEPGEEPVERLVAREPRDRGQDPERVRGQEDDALGMARPLRRGSAFAICSSL